jgi:tetratricopeptide (TPR) repeat protein
LAAQEYRAALAISPHSAEAAANLANIYLSRSRSEDARSVLVSTLAAGGESASLYYEMGVLNAKESKWEEARFAFSKAISLDPSREDCYMNLGKIAWNQGRVDEAIYQYQRAVRIAPKNAAYLTTLGSLYLYGKNDRPQALSYFRQALAAEPHGPDAETLRELIAKLQLQAAR